MNEQIQTLLSHFYQFAKDNLGFDRDAQITFAVDEENSKNPLGTTAHYNPANMEVTVYTSGRHPKDILRSVAHELVHHRQNCQGKMDEPRATGPGYAQNDMHLRALEEEAYLEGNMCFRDWEDGYKANQEVETIYESVIKIYTKEKLKMNTKEDMRTIVREAVSRVLTKNKIQEMDYEDDAYMDDLEKEFPFLKDDPEMGGRAPADVQAAMDDEMPAEEEDEMEMGETVTEGDEMSRTITQIEKIGDEISRIAKMSIDPAVVERIEMIDDMVTDVLAQMQGVEPGFDSDGYSKMPGQRPMEEKSTDKHDDNPALVGGQDSLPDNLQKAIIDKEDDEEESTNEAEDFYAQLRSDAKTISEDWNKNIRNKRSALLNERLMKAWKFTK